MVYEKIIQGITIDFRDVREVDADFTLKLRQNSELTRFLPRIEGGVEQQAAWIRSQRVCEGDFFFLISDKQGNPLGTIGVYDIADSHAESGRFVSLGDPVQNMEAVLMNMDFAFDTLGLEYVLANVMLGNNKIIRMNEKFGTVFTGKYTDERGHEMIHGRLYKNAYYNYREGIQSMICRVQC